MKQFLKLSLCILSTLLIGGISGFATASSINGWYVTINKPSFNPPNYLFGPVWTTLYILMGISLYMILQSDSNELRKKAVTIFSIQLFLNFCWSFIFLNFQSLGLAFVEIILMWISILTMIIIFYKINKTAALFQIPYLLWVSFASILNGSIWYLN
ncbi:MAG TPA: tryptophan-rich sensory protein [Bacteroidia bacterium]|nr:tryptophan-rich sensory protein [Bacteroidia bacterium]